jgi:hypothetical protein
MEKKIINIVAENTAKEVVKILKEYRAAGKSLDDVIAAFESQNSGDSKLKGVNF